MPRKDGRPTAAERRAAERAAWEVKVRAALRWTEADGPDIPAPTWETHQHDGYTSGFYVNVHTGIVDPAWSGIAFHGVGSPVPVGQIASQGAISLFSTKRRALAWLRSQVERKAAERLAAIDDQLAAEGA